MAKQKGLAGNRVALTYRESNREAKGDRSRRSGKLRRFTGFSEKRAERPITCGALWDVSMLGWLGKLFTKKPPSLMVRVDQGVIRIAPKGSAWLAVPLRMPPALDTKILDSCEDGKWYTFEELGIVPE